MGSFEKLIRSGIELTVRVKGTDRLAVIQLITKNYRHLLQIQYRRVIPNKPTVINVPVSDITTIITSETTKYTKYTKYLDSPESNQIVQLLRYSGDSVAIRFPSVYSRDRFAIELNHWLQTIGVKVKMYNWL